MAKKQEKMTLITLDALAVMIKGGFDDMDERFKKVDERFDKIENDIKDFKKENSREHEEINLRLGEVAYRFEIAALEKRVERLEKIASSRFVK